MISATLYAFDFDGTLAPIVTHRDEAQMDPATEREIVALAERHPVIIISGRSLDDLARRVPLPLTRLIGNHGLEGLAAEPGLLQKAQKTVAQWRLQLATWGGLPIGASLEDKAATLSLHYRLCADPGAAEQALRERALRLSPIPRTLPGKRVLNLIPPGSPHKGTALLRAMRHLEVDSAFYLGDDTTDEDVFALQDPRIVGIRVGSKTIPSQQEVANWIAKGRGAWSLRPHVATTGKTDG